jgi:AcrR family transcriptional regulator
MRHKGVDKEETRLKILEAASCGFRKYGFAGMGVDGLSKAAGVTSGAFYSHFGSKDGAFNAALAAGLDEVIEGIPKFQNEYGTDWVKAFAEYYLGKPHRNDLEKGCAMAALTPEVVRFGPKVQEEFENKMTVIAALMARGLMGHSDEARLAKAWSILGLLIGGISVARAMQSTKASEDVAQAITVAAINLAGLPCTEEL